MDYSVIGVSLAFLFGSIRALLLWRATPRVDVVNVAVVAATARNPGEGLATAISKAGSSPYLDLASALATLAVRLSAEPRRRPASELREELRRESLKQLAVANQKLRRTSWLDTLALIAIVLAGISAMLVTEPSGKSALGLVAATLLMLANVYTARSLCLRLGAGASVLVDSLTEALSELEPDP